MPLGLFPLPPQTELTDLFKRLVGALAAHDYASTSAIPFPGRPWHLVREPENLRRFLSGRSNAFEGSPWAGLYRRAFAAQKPEAVALYDVFHLGQHATRAELSRLLGGELVSELEARQVLVPAGGKLVSRARASGFAPIIVISDTPSIHEHEKSSFVFCGRCSSRLVEAVRADLAESPRGGRSLDLCTGSGIQALNGAASFEEVWGGDLNPRAVAFATANAAANGIAHARFVESDLFAKVEGTFDLITANTPFLLLDEGSKALDGYGGKYGMEVELRLYEALDRHLRPGGTSLIVASSAFVDGRNLLEERLRDIFGGKPYEIDLFPISQYYSVGHYRAYEAANVRKCILYVVRTRKDAAPSLRVTAHPFGPIKGASFDVKVRLERELARRRYLKSQAQARA
jgi:hypothetical protein